MPPGSVACGSDGCWASSGSREFVSLSARRAPSADAATLGEPSYVWRSGQERRLQLIRRYVPLEDRWILDVGCGIGTYMKRFREFSPHVFGIDVAVHRLQESSVP